MMDKLMHWCVHRAKFKRISKILLIIATAIALQAYIQQSAASSLLSCDNLKCIHGLCKEGRCVCDQGWQGSSCQRCGGRVRLTENSGYVTDGFGNYTSEMQCTWLIESNKPNATIRIQIVNFETECIWDHLYIFDGGSVFSPLLAAYRKSHLNVVAVHKSGVMLRDGVNGTKLPELVAYSGRAYLYFSSDIAYNMSGFNISYSLNSCPRNCSGHGPCVDGICTCWAGWTGSACDVPICSPGCDDHGHCDKEQHMCICDPGYTGHDCSFEIKVGWWEEVIAKGTIQGRALHQAVVVGDAMWVVGGENFVHQVFHNVVKFNFSTNSWETILPTSNEPANRFGHSLIEYKNNLYMFGGMLYNGTVKNELWKFDIEKKSWIMLGRNNTNHNCHLEACNPLAVVGHTATLVSTSQGHKMVVIFGHNPLYGYLNNVQEYDLTTGKWELVMTSGAIVKGGFGHTSVYDRRTQQIYVYGGYHSYGADAGLVDFLYAYNPWSYKWKLYTPSHSHRYMHSAVIHHGLMLVYGGNNHNSTSFNSDGLQCFSSDFLAYDIACETWHTLSFPASSNTGISRFGHTAVIYNGSMYVFGGFNGQMLSDIEKFNPGNCRTYLTSEECDRVSRGVKCIWDYEASKCQLFSTDVLPSCGQKTDNVTSLCARQTLCPSCIENNYNCVWCGTSCYHGQCSRGVKETENVEECEEAQSSNCDILHNCHACHTEYHCGWQKDDKCYTFVRETGNGTEKAHLLDDYRVTCELPCSSRNSCENCTQAKCMWCSSQQLCVEANSYAAVFPVGQCMKWTTQQIKCPGLMCKDIQTCDKCQKNPRCGWCDNGSGTGRGRCYEGSDLGVMAWNGTAYVLNETICPASQWYFTSCPQCQCNGHSKCINGTNVCQQPCQDLTEGPFCEHCMAGYYGYAINGGNCTPCFCNNHSHLCHQETGTCYCNTKGITGKHCNRCDESNLYIGYPTEEGGSCYYNLSIDFQYTFNMTKPEDQHLTNINFMNIPSKPDVDVEFSITCSDHALVNITISSSSSPDQLLHGSQKCVEKFMTHISHVDHLFGSDNTTFYVRVFDFTTPLVIQISFTQHRTLDLLQFFITFSSCFLSLLIIAAILWKIKQKYDLYRRRQRLFVEMEQMASRPFAGVALEIEKGNKCIVEGKPTDGRKKNHPTPIALEPCSGGKAAVLSLIVRMPLGNEDYTPEGQSGLAIASALVSLGTLCKNVDAIKENNKLDNWKSSNSSTCI